MEHPRMNPLPATRSNTELGIWSIVDENECTRLFRNSAAFQSLTPQLTAVVADSSSEVVVGLRHAN